MLKLLPGLFSRIPMFSAKPDFSAVQSTAIIGENRVRKREVVVVYLSLIHISWSERVQWGCERYYDERERKREMEIFKVNRGYKELVERLDIERVSDIKYLPWDKTCLLYTSRCV